MSVTIKFTASEAAAVLELLRSQGNPANNAVHGAILAVKEVVEPIRKYEVTVYENDDFSWGEDGTKRIYFYDGESFEDASEYYSDGELYDSVPMSRATTSPRVVVKDLSTGKTQTFKQSCHFVHAAR